MTITETRPFATLEIITQEEKSSKAKGQESTKIKPETLPVYMVDNIIYQWGTEKRAVTSTVGLGMFDQNKNIGKSRMNILPEGTIVVVGPRRTETRKGTRTRVRTRAGIVFTK